MPRDSVPAGTVAYLGEPAVEPVELLAAIARATDGLSAVRTLSRCWAQFGNEPPGLVVGVQLEPDTPQVRAAVAESIGSVWSTLQPGYAVDIAFDGDGGSVTTWMRKNVNPFHRAHA
ncbi:MAG: enhanced serine sensitivity protein SseB C-terminal domain-containing protein [Pseudolysinimonas sp.]